MVGCPRISWVAAAPVRPLTPRSQSVRRRRWSTPLLGVLVLIAVTLTCMPGVSGLVAVPAVMVDGPLGSELFAGPVVLEVTAEPMVAGAAVGADSADDTAPAEPVRGRDVARVAPAPLGAATLLVHRADALADPDRAPWAVLSRVGVTGAVLGLGARDVSRHSGPGAVLSFRAGSGSGEAVAGSASELNTHDRLTRVRMEAQATPTQVSPRPLVRPG